MATFDIDDFLRSQSTAAGVTPSASTTTSGVPFYKRPIQIPAGVKTAGRTALRAGARFAGPAGLLAAVPQLAQGLKFLAEKGASAFVGEPTVRATTPPPLPSEFAPATASRLDLEDQSLGQAVSGGFVRPFQSAVDADAVIRRNFAPQRGTGAISLNGGPAQAIDTRPQSLEEAQARVETSRAFATRGPTDPLGRFVSALIGVKRVTGDAAQRAAQAKAAAAALTAQGTAARGAAALETSRFSTALARAALERDPTDLAGAAQILKGAAGKGVQAFPGLGPKDPTTIVTPKGEVFSVQPTTLATEANIKETMRSQRKTRAEVIAAYKAANIPISPSVRDR